MDSFLESFCSFPKVVGHLIEQFHPQQYLNYIVSILIVINTCELNKSLQIYWKAHSEQFINTLKILNWEVYNYNIKIAIVI